MVCDDACVLHCACIEQPVAPHVLRHTFAITAVRKGISLPVLQHHLGHDRLLAEEVVWEFREKW